MLLWGGGLWGWLDPVTPMRAVALLERRAPRRDGRRPPRPRGDRPGRRTSTPRSPRRAGSACSDRRVHVNRGWVPYARARRLAGRGRPRRLGPPRPPRGALRAPHADPRLPVGRPARGRHARRRAGRPRRARAASAGRSRPATRRRSPPRARRCSARRAPPRASGSPPSRRRCAGSAWPQPLVEWCATARERPRRAVRRGVVRQGDARPLPVGARRDAGRRGRRARRWRASAAALRRAGTLR